MSLVALLFIYPLMACGFNYPPNWQTFHEWGDDEIALNLNNSQIEIQKEKNKNKFWFERNREKLEKQYGPWECFVIRHQSVVGHAHDCLAILQPLVFESMGDIFLCINRYHTLRAEIRMNALFRPDDSIVGSDGNRNVDDLLISDPPPHTLEWNKKQLHEVSAFLTNYKKYSPSRLSMEVFLRPSKSSTKLFGFVCLVDTGAPYALSLVGDLFDDLSVFGFPTLGNEYVGYIGMQRVAIFESGGNAENCNVCGYLLLDQLIIVDRRRWKNKKLEGSFLVRMRASWVPPTATRVLSNKEALFDDSEDKTEL